MATLCRRNGHLSAGRKGHLSEKATFLSAERPLLCRQANYLGGLASARRTGAAVCVCAAGVGAVVTWHDVHEMRGSRLSVSSLANAVLFEHISESADQGSAATVVTWYVVHKIFDKNGRLSRDRPPGYSSTETWEEIESRSADAGSGLASIQRFARAGRRWVGGMKQEGAPFCWRKRWMLRERKAYARVRCAWP